MEILWLPPVAALLLGYLLGSIPFGLLLAKAAGVGDLRKIGSGNIGATNVLRTGKKGTAAATLLFDIGKGVAAVLGNVPDGRRRRARWRCGLLRPLLSCLAQIQGRQRRCED